MISQDELLKLVKPFPIDYTPQYREFVCAKCAGTMDKAWHVHFTEHGYKREIHLCSGCGSDYGMFADKKTLVVVATNNGKEYLEKLLPTIKYPYLVIDTGSTDKESIEYFDSLQCSKARIDGGFCLGAYEYGYRNYEFEEYFFMHDSMIVKKPDFIEDFRTKGEVVSWIRFDCAWEHGPDYLRSLYGDKEDLPQYAFFGPIFYATRNAMNILDQSGYMPPKVLTRGEMIAMETGYAIAFHRAGVQAFWMEDYDNARIDETRDYVYFDKFRPNRD